METFEFEFECVMQAFKKDKNGCVVTMVIHPDEVPEVIFRDFIGSRYNMKGNRLDANDKPMDRQEEFAGDRAVRIAGMLCREPKFWEFLYARSDIPTKDYESATQWLRFYLELESRSQLKTNIAAQEKLVNLYREYSSWKPTS